MPFKVVQTSERGKTLLTCVPQKWESDGILMWPRSKADKLLKAEESTPNEDWLSMTCTVKRNNLSFHEAQLAINLMSHYTDTDEDNNCSLPPPKQKGENNNFNDIATACLEKSKAKQSKGPLNDRMLTVNHEETFIPYNSTTMTLEASENKENEITVNSLTTNEASISTANMDMNNYEILLLDSQNQNIETTRDNIAEKLDSIIVILATMQENQKFLAETQQTLMLQTAALNTQMEELVKRALVPLKQNALFKPIASVDELQHFEDRLINQNHQEELLKQLCCICGISKGKGFDNCFKLIDIMFDRGFLKNCSWTGVSRDENSRKVCFKGYTRTIKLFYNVIQVSDTNFSQTECEQFFKNVLRNSNRRSEAKMMRASASKHRPKKTPYSRTSRIESQVVSIENALGESPSNKVVSIENASGESPSNSEVRASTSGLN